MIVGFYGYGSPGYESHSSWSSGSGGTIPGTVNLTYTSGRGTEIVEERRGESEWRNILPSSSGKDLVRPEEPSYKVSGTGEEQERGSYPDIDIITEENGYIVSRQ